MNIAPLTPSFAQIWLSLELHPYERSKTITEVFSETKHNSIYVLKTDENINFITSHVLVDPAQSSAPFSYVTLSYKR